MVTAPGTELISRPDRPRSRQDRLAAAEQKRQEYQRKVSQALMLRAAGYSYGVIAQRLGWSGHAMARKAILKAQEQYIREPTQELINLELKRLDDLQSYLWPAAQRGDARAVSEILDIMQARWKLLGLEAPQKIDLSVLIDAVAAATPDVPKSEIEAEVAGILERAGFS